MSQNIWSSAPLVRLTLPFALGILVCNYYSGVYAYYLAFAAIVFLAIYLVTSLRYFKLPKQVAALCMSGCCFFAGAAVCQYNKLNLRPDFFAGNLKDSSVLLVRIYEPLQERDNTYKAIAEVKAVLDKENTPASGRVILYFRKENLTRLPKYGDLFLIANTVKPLKKPQNPQVFDYAGFMRYRKIYHSAYLQASQILYAGQNTGYASWQAIYTFKEKLLAVIDFYIEGADERAIAKALWLGDERDMLPHITASYAGTGTMHVLSVSGLHVGFIFLILNFLLRTLHHTKWGRFFRVIILICALGFYGILTGLSPSVLRSVIMFSFLVIGLNIRKITNIYNSIAFSALGLLVFDPFLLMQLGFQLSYIALVGIVWLHPHISKIWQPQNKKLKYIRDLLAVSLAAQIATFPLGLYYFNQFPAYFLISNLLVIPWSMVSLFAGCGFLVVSAFTFLPEIIIAWAGKLVYWLILGLNKTVTLLSGLPYAQWEGTFISLAECIHSYIAIVLLAYAFIHQRKKLLQAGLGVLVIFFSVRSINKFTSFRENKLTVHAIPKTSVLSLKEGDRMYLLGDTAFIQNMDQRKFHVNRYAYSYFVPKPYIQPVKNTSGFSSAGFYFSAPYGQAGKQRFLWLRNKNDIPAEGFGFADLDFIILSGNLKIMIKDIKHIAAGRVIFTADNSFYRCALWEAECKELGIPFTNLQKDNSFAITYGHL